MYERKQLKIPKELKFAQCEDTINPQQLARDYHLNVHNPFQGRLRMISLESKTMHTSHSFNLVLKN